MDHLGITIEARQEKKILLNQSLVYPTITFWLFTLMPLIIYLAYSIGMLSSVVSSPYHSLEQATALVTTDSGAGTAFLVGSKKLLTARHVVEDVQIGAEVNLLFEQLTPQVNTKAILKWKDDTIYPSNNMIDFFLTDVAVLELVEPSLVRKISPLMLGNSDEVPTLTPIIAIGYPGGSYSITRGDINSNQIDNKELFKIDAATNPGNSGGPVLSEEDETVIGMLVGQRGPQTQGENIANKINNIRMLLNDAGQTID